MCENILEKLTGVEKGSFGVSLVSPAQLLTCRDASPGVYSLT